MYDLVDRDVYEAVEKATSKEFAFSYLVKARQVGKRITPFTTTAWDRLRTNPYAVEALNQHRIILVRPEPFSEEREARYARQRAA